MTFRQFIQALACELGVSEAEARRLVGKTFDTLNRYVLGHGDSVVIPKFGTFHRVTSGGGYGSGALTIVKVPRSRHIRFRAAKAAKVRVP